MFLSAVNPAYCISHIAKYTFQSAILACISPTVLQRCSLQVCCECQSGSCLSLNLQLSDEHSTWHQGPAERKLLGQIYASMQHAQARQHQQAASWVATMTTRNLSAWQQRWGICAIANGGSWQAAESMLQSPAMDCIPGHGGLTILSLIQMISNPALIFKAKRLLYIH